jgi:multidrug efflux pump subunit AcrA (membrane-fusion protein)
VAGPEKTEAKPQALKECTMFHGYHLCRQQLWCLLIVSVAGFHLGLSDSRAQSDKPPAASSVPSVAPNDPVSEFISIRSPILKPPITISIASGVPGVVESVFVKEGDVVNTKDPLLKIRDDEARMALQQAMLTAEIAQLKSGRDVEIRLAEKSAEVAAQELNRALKANSLAPDTYPPNEIDRYRLVYERSKLEIERATLDQEASKLAAQLAQAEKAQALLKVERHTILAPVRGIIASIDRQTGEWNDANSKCLELVAVDQLRLEGFINADEAALLTVGQTGQLRITTPSGFNDAEGKISFISPQANPVNGLIKIFMDVDNRERKLRPGLPVTAKALRKAAKP